MHCPAVSVYLYGYFGISSALLFSTFAKDNTETPIDQPPPPSLDNSTYNNRLLHDVLLSHKLLIAEYDEIRALVGGWAT